MIKLILGNNNENPKLWLSVESSLEKFYEYDIRTYTTLTPKIKEKGMHIYLILHTQVCDIKNIAHLSVRYKRYRTLILIKTFQTNLKSFYEIVISHQLYIGCPNHYDCGFKLMCKYFLN